jgi:hypothetical protein
MHAVNHCLLAETSATGLILIETGLGPGRHPRPRRDPRRRLGPADLAPAGRGGDRHPAGNPAGILTRRRAAHHRDPPRRGPLRRPARLPRRPGPRARRRTGGRDRSGTQLPLPPGALGTRPRMEGGRPRPGERQPFRTFVRVWDAQVAQLANYVAVVASTRFGGGTVWGGGHMVLLLSRTPADPTTGDEAYYVVDDPAGYVTQGPSGTTLGSYNAQSCGEHVIYPESMVASALWRQDKELGLVARGGVALPWRGGRRRRT